MRVIYVPKEKLYPRFGSAHYKSGTIRLRDDLPLCVLLSVTQHEMQHIEDGPMPWLWGEIRANVLGGMRRPFGWIVCIFMSLSPARLMFYIRSFRGKR